MGHGLAYDLAVKCLQDEADLQNRGRINTRSVSLTEAVGRICARAVCSPIPMPSFDNSAMDGFVLNSRNTDQASPENSIRLDVLGTIAAGDAIIENDKSSSYRHVPFSAYEIFTGAPKPQSDYYDTVLRVEDAVIEDGQLVISKPIRKGLHIRYLGEDIAIGDCILDAGTKITPKEVMVLASVGQDTVEVYDLRIGIISTGSELITTAETRRDQNSMNAKVFNSNAAFLQTSLMSLGRCRQIGIVKDDKKALRDAIFQAAGEFDLLISTGGVSAGGFDFVPEAIETLGEIVFHHVAMRPGHPVLFGVIHHNRPNRVPYFGLPGTPAATAATTRFLLRPFLDRLLSIRPSPPLLLKLTRPVQNRGLTFYRAIRAGDHVEIITGKHSLRSSLQANCWVKAELEASAGIAAEQVSVYDE